MGKKVTIVILLAAMLLGAVAMSAGAATEQPYQVGYAKVDINPYWHAWMAWSKAENNSAIPNAGTYPYRPTSDLTEKDFKEAIKNMFKEIKETSIREVNTVMTRSH